MFEGTVRTNLDPLQQYSDSEICEVKISYQTRPFIVKLIVSIQLTTPLVKRSRRVVDEYKSYA